jgi:hypothetical protein
MAYEKKLLFNTVDGVSTNFTGANFPAPSEIKISGANFGPAIYHLERTLGCGPFCKGLELELHPADFNDDIERSGYSLICEFQPSVDALKVNSNTINVDLDFTVQFNPLIHQIHVIDDENFIFNI